VKASFDAKVKTKKAELQPGDLVLLRDNKAKKGEPKWTGPWVIHKVRDMGTLQVKDLRGRIRPDLVHVNQTRPGTCQAARGQKESKRKS
jgi:hypothetical protein